MHFCIEIIALSLVVVARSGGHGKEAATGNKNRSKSVVNGSDQYVSDGASGNDQYIHSILGTKITIKPG